MNKTRRISSLLSALLLAWGSANAAGLGKLTVQSALGQPLKAEIELLSVTKEELADITARLASSDAFRQARIDRQEALSSLRFDVDQRANGQPIIRITSATSVPDPFLDMLIELNWSSGRMIREYTILLDPPAAAKPAEAIRPATLAESPKNGAFKPAVPAADSVAKPKPALPAPTPSAPKRYGPVRSGETLRAIASKVKPAEVSLEQMMVGLYQANKDAFQSNNMNRLNRGRVLNVPDADVALANTRAEAARTVRGHAVEWHAYRRKLAEMAGETPEPKIEEKAAGKIAPKEEAKPAPAPSAPKDVLKLSKGEPGGTGKADAKTQERMHAMEEEIAAKGRALQEAQDRVSQLERTVRDMQKLLEMKAQEAKAPAAPAPAPAVQPPPAPVAEEPAAPEPEPKPAPVPAEAPKPAPVVAPLPVAEPSTSWISTFISNPIYIGGIVAALLLSALLWMMMVGSKRRQGLTKFEDSIMTGGEFKNNAVFNASAGNVASGAGALTESSMLLTDFSRLGMGAIDSHEVDPIAEAEVYMAYGRDAQAEEILREALVKDPSRHEIALKLLELYATRKDTTSFETSASELYAGLSGQNTPVWQRAAEMGRSIDPQNPLYRVAAPQNGGLASAPASAKAAAVVVPAAAAAASVAMASSTLSSMSDSSDLGDLNDLSSLNDWGDAPKSAGADTMLSPNAGAGKAAQPTHDNLLEFEAPVKPALASEPDFDLPEPSLDEDLTTQPQAKVEFDLAPPEIPATEDLAFETSPDFDEISGTAAESAFEPASSVEPEALSTLDFPDEIETSSVEDMPVLDLSGIDLNLEDEPLTEVQAAAAPEPVQEAETIVGRPALEVADDFDPFGELAATADFDLTPEFQAEPETSSAPVDELVAEAPTEIESGIDPLLHEEVNTKLDLARAYMEMGDREGAREILQEVLGEGDPQQKSEAEKLMAEAA